MNSTDQASRPTCARHSCDNIVSDRAKWCSEACRRYQLTGTCVARLRNALRTLGDLRRAAIARLVGRPGTDR